MTRTARLLAVTLLPCLASACGPYVVQGGDPHPTTVLPQGSFALEIAPNVEDEQDFQNIRITDVRATLARGFHNALGAQAVSDRAAQPIVLAIDECSFVLERVGHIGVLTARVRGRWLAPDGTQIGSFAGRPVPRNGYASDGQRQLEDLLEVMYEEVIHDFAQTRQNATATATAGAEQPSATRISGIR